MVVELILEELVRQGPMAIIAAWALWRLREMDTEHADRLTKFREMHEQQTEALREHTKALSEVKGYLERMDQGE